MFYLQCFGEGALELYSVDPATRRLKDVCSCDTCLVREVITGIWPVFERFVDAQLRIALSAQMYRGTHRSSSEDARLSAEVPG